MKYNNDGEFDVYELFNNEKYRARLVLGFYAILIAILIISLRTGSSKSNNTKKEDSNKETAITEKENEDENVDDEEDNAEDEDVEDEDENEEELSDNKDDIEKKFVYILQNNYEFDYKLTLDDLVVESIGKRTDKETLFNVKSKKENATCYGKENTLMCNSDGNYKETDYPYFFFNYYDPKEVVNILNEATYNSEDNKYHIDNVSLYSFGDGTMDLSKVEKEKKIDNTIELIEKNGKVVGLKMNFSNLFNNEDANLKKVILELNYSNFGFVDGIKAPEGIKK